MSKGRRRYLVKSMFRQAKALERQGQWRKASHKFQQILELDPLDAHTHLGLARLQARREQSSIGTSQQSSQSLSARQAFERGTSSCPNSIHLWQAWALYEQQSHNNLVKAQELYQQALKIDPYNPYVCHAFGLMQYTQLSNHQQAQQLWEQALNKTSTAALVCSLAQLFIQEHQDYQKAKTLYQTHLPRLSTEKDQTEVYLAMAWLEERYLANPQRAQSLIQQSIQNCPTTSSLAHVAMARLQERQGRHNNNNHQNEDYHQLNSNQHNKQSHKHNNRQNTKRNNNRNNSNAHAKRMLAKACQQNDDRHNQEDQYSAGPSRQQQQDGGRVYNAWAHLEVKDHNYDKARRILAKGRLKYPKDPMLLQAAGKVEERVGNYTGARDLYGASLAIEPTAPTLVAYALLELKRPSASSSTSKSLANNHQNQVNNQGNNNNSSKTTATNYQYVKGLFEEALLLDPRHGPAYNAYGAAELKHGTTEAARQIFERGVRANCADAASIFHGFAKMELSLGNLDAAQDLLQRGLAQAHLNDVGMDSQHRERAVFLSHSLGMMELNMRNRPTRALQVFMDGMDRYGNSSQLLLGAALCQVKLGKQTIAQELFERAVLVDSKHAQAWQAWGVMEMRAGNITTARKLFDCGIKSAPKHGALWQAYATMEGRIGNTDKARSLFLSGMKKAPRHVPLYQSWAVLELRENNVTAAKRLLTKALTLNKRNGAGWLIAANIEKRMGNDGLVGLILRRGIECAPTDAELYRALGEHLVHKGEIVNAREIFEKGIEVNPLHAPTYHSLAELEARVFNVDGLAKLNKKAAQIFNNNAMQPANPSTTQAWGAKIRARKHNEIPKGIAALAEQIVQDDDDNSRTGEDEDEDDNDVDPFEELESSLDLEEGDFIDHVLPATEEAEASTKGS